MSYLFPIRILAVLVLTGIGFNALSRKSAFWKARVADREI